MPAAKIRVVIADDEPLARARVRQFLENETGIEIVAECGDGAQAVTAIQEFEPDLVFLDIQMPELDGFAVLAQLQPDRRPAVIFVTAYDQFALRAFDVHAVDYVLKPFDRDRFQAAVRRAIDRVHQKQTGDLNTRLSAFLSEVRAEPKYLERLAVKSSGRVILIRVTDVDWVEAADNYVNLHVGTEAHLHRETMTSIEGRLPPNQFMRISRSTIVNVDRIRELQPLFHGEYAVILKNGAKLTLSRSYRDKLQHLLDNSI